MSQISAPGSCSSATATLGRRRRTPSEASLVAETFLRHPGQVLSREQLLSRVWGYDHDPGSNVVDLYVGYLRRKRGHDLIETVRGAGDRLNSAQARCRYITIES
jgi:DNA-binding response OmpR family regulator